MVQLARERGSPMKPDQSPNKTPRADWPLSHPDKDEEPVSDEDLKKYDYMKEDFLAAIRLAGKIQRGTTAVFNLKGFLLRCAEGILAFRPALPDAPATRGTDETQKPLQQLPFINRVAKDVGEARLEISTRQKEKGLEVVVNAWDKETSTEIRPLRIQLRDSEGQKVLESATAEEGDGPPILEPPVSGNYVLSLSWANHKEDIRLEFVE